MSYTVAETFAKLIFFQYFEALAPGVGGVRQTPAESWQDLSAGERTQLVAAVRSWLVESASVPCDSRNEHDCYFAKPGEAEWGC